MPLEVNQGIFWSWYCYNDSKWPKTGSISRALFAFYPPISASAVSAITENKISRQQSWIFRLLSESSVLSLLPLLLVLLRIVGLDGRKEEQVGSGTRFSSEFSGQRYMFCFVFVLFFFLRFLGLLDWIALILVWNERSLPPTKVRWQSCLWPLKLVTSQAVQSTLRACQEVKNVDSKFVTRTIFHLCPVDNADFDFDDFCMHS